MSGNASPISQTGHKPGCPALSYLAGHCTCYGDPTEMASLREIKQKLDAVLDEGRQHTETIVMDYHALSAKLDALAEAQGKLLTALNDTNAHCETIEGLISITRKQQNERLDVQRERIEQLATRISEATQAMERASKKRKGRRK